MRRNDVGIPIKGCGLVSMTKILSNSIYSLEGCFFYIFFVKNLLIPPKKSGDSNHFQPTPKTTEALQDSGAMIVRVAVWADHLWLL